MMTVIEGEKMSLGTLVKVARGYEKVKLTSEVKKRVSASQRLLERLLHTDKRIYGVTTGVGIWEKIPLEGQHEELQKRVILSHMTGAGDPIREEEVRAAMVLRANVIAKGYSAVRLEVLETLLAMLNQNVVPVVFQKGSLGTSGDLVPLAHIAAVIMGEGEACYEGKRRKGRKAMEKAGIPYQKFALRDGMGLINGTSISTGIGGMALYDGFGLFNNALIASAMTVDSLQSSLDPFDPKIHSLRPYRGQGVVAKTLRKLLKNPASSIQHPASRKAQDAFSLRCIPQVLGASLDAFQYAKEQLEIEMNSASDNPLFIPSTFSKSSIQHPASNIQFLSGGNFHGQSVAIALDLFAIAMAEVGSLSERHINRLLNPNLSGLPGFLVEKPGLNTGLMLLQYTACDLVSENKILAHPAVTDNASVSADQEDHVSMASLSARKARTIVENVKTILAIQFICSAQAMEFREVSEVGMGTKAAYQAIRRVVPKLINDRPLSPDIEKIRRLIEENGIMEAVENEIGKIKE